MLSKSDIKHIVNLSRINIMPKEEGEFSRNISSILDYVSSLKKVTSDIKTILPSENFVSGIFREDENDNKELEKMDGELVNAVPEKKNEYVKVKRVL